MSAAVLDQVAEPTLTPRRSWKVRLMVWVPVILALQAFALSKVDKPWDSGDSRLLYLPTARNMLRHGSYSVMDNAPYLPSIVKMPGYSFFLVALQAVGGESIVLIQILQFVLLAITALVTAQLARRFFDDRVALVAGLFVASHPAFSFMAMRVLSETLTQLMALLHVWALVIFFENGKMKASSRRRDFAVAAGTGLSLGVLVLLRQTFAMLLPMIAIAAIVALGLTQWKRAVRQVGVLCLATGLLVGPWCVRNVLVADALLPFGANSGVSLLISERQYAQNEYIPGQIEYLETIERELGPIDARLGMPSGTSPGMTEGLGGGPAREAALDARLEELALSELAEQDVLTIVQRVPWRMASLWSGKGLFVALDPIGNFQMLAVLLGVVWLGLRRRELWPLWILGLYLSLFHLVFHVEARYSFPARPALLILGAAASVEGVRWFRQRWAAVRETAPSSATS
ncbi:MAG: ArnT family glycosyltransferase [Acidimicrobiales bacterium]